MATELADLLRRNDVQVTVQRIAVLRAVSDQPHITADGVAEVVRAELGVISKQAVYDALGILVERRLVRRIQPAGSPARYEDRVGDNHHHLVCRSCHHMVDVDCAVGFAPCLSPSESMGYEIDEAEVIYWGHCSKCLAEASQTKSSEYHPSEQRATEGEVPQDVSQRQDFRSCP